MARLITIPLTSRPAGRTDFVGVSVPTTLRVATARINRTTLTSTTLRIDWTLELSQDGGQTWLPWGGAGTVGGDVINPDTSLPYTESSFTVAFPNESNPNRQVRGSVTSNETVTTTLTLDVN